jgi:hypothetical protein
VKIPRACLPACLLQVLGNAKGVVAVIISLLYFRNPVSGCACWCLCSAMYCCRWWMRICALPPLWHMLGIKSRVPCCVSVCFALLQVNFYSLFGYGITMSGVIMYSQVGL